MTNDEKIAYYRSLKFMNPYQYMEYKLLKLERENERMRKCLEHYRDNGYSKARDCFKELDKLNKV